MVGSFWVKSNPEEWGQQADMYYRVQWVPNEDAPSMCKRNKDGTSGWAKVLTVAGREGVHTLYGCVDEGNMFRLHLCAETPCKAHWVNSKYGRDGQPLHLILADAPAAPLPPPPGPPPAPPPVPPPPPEPAPAAVHEFRKHQLANRAKPAVAGGKLITIDFKQYGCRKIVSAEYHELLGGRSNLSNTEWDDFYKMVDWQGDKPKMARTPKNFRKLIKRWHASWRDDNHVVLGRAPSARGWLVGNKVRQRKPGFYGVHLKKVPLVCDLPHSDRDPTTGSICFRCLVPGADLVEARLSE